MHVNLEQSVAKRPVNLSLSIQAVATAKELGLNVSRICDEYLRQYVKQELERRWKEENAEFLVAYNTVVEEEGLPLDQWRAF